MQGALQAIMKTLLGYIGKDKHADSLVEKLMLRFETATKPAQWRNLAFCLTQVPHNLSAPVSSTKTPAQGCCWLSKARSHPPWLHADPVGRKPPTFNLLLKQMLSDSSQTRLHMQ